MRQEALPLAYRKTTFHLDDIDDLIRLLVAVGKIGRDNIESLELVWESKAEDELKNDQAADADDLSFMLPALHAARCVQLLKQCKRLAFLRLCIESDLILNIAPKTFKEHAGISELCSLQGIRTVQIWDLWNEQPNHCSLAQWLKEKIESKGVERGQVSLTSGD